MSALTPCASSALGAGVACLSLGATRRIDTGWKALGIALCALAFSAAPARADQFVEAADNAKIDCTLSRGELTRIALIDDGFANVSKIASAYPYNDFTITHEPVRGDIYISVPPQFASDRVSFFATSKVGFVYKFACRTVSQEASQVFVTNPALKVREAEEWEQTSGPDDAAIRLIEAMAGDAVLPGFTGRTELGLPRKTGSIEVQLVAEYTGAELTGQRFRLRNLGKAPLELGKDREGPAGAIAFAYGRDVLAPNEVTSAFLVFRKGGLPDDLNYSKNGMIYGARLMEATRSLRISDPEFAANLDEHIRQCVFYDLLLGRYSMKQLAESDDIWTTIAPGSAARAQKFVTRQADDSVTASIVTCRDAYASLSNQWAGLVDSMALSAGRQLYPRQTAALAKTKLIADLPVAYQYLSGVSKNASDIFRQVLTINAMNQAMHGFAGASGTSSIDVFAQTRADIQTERTYASIAENAMKWVPILNVVLTVVFYAMFPVIFPLFLIPKTGPLALRGYVTGFFYLAAWGPLFVILHMILMFKGASDVAAAGSGTGLSLATFAGMADVNRDIGLLAGYLVASVPFLAGGIAKGALAISGQATSYLNPSQNAAEEAAREASTGNVSLGNSNLDNSTVFSRQFAQGALNPSVSYGAAQTRGFSDVGTQTTSFGGAEFATVPNSQYPFTPTLGQDFTSRLSTMASQSRGQSETYSNLAQQSTSSAVTRFNEIRNAYSQGRSSETVSGTGSNDSIGTAFSEVDNASTTLQRQFGLSRRAADDITVSWFLNGEAGIEAKAQGGVLSGGIGAKGGRNQNWTDSDVGIASEDRSRITGALQQLSDTRNWSSTREGFLRQTSSSSSSQVSTSAAGLSRSLTEAQTYSVEARRAEELASRLENQASWYEGANAAGSLNLSQAYREWGMAELEANRDYYGPVRFDDINFQMSAQGQQLQARFVESYADRLHDDIESQLTLPEFAPVSRPAVTGQASVRAHGPSGGGGSGSFGAAPDTSGIRDEVRAAQAQGRGRIGQSRGNLDVVTRGAKGASEEAADDVKEW